MATATYKPIIWRLILYVFIALLTAAALLYSTRPHLMAIYRSRASADGFVVRRECENHAQVVYKFQRGARWQLGRSMAPYNCDLMKPGQKISVWYNPESTSESFLVEPKINLQGEIFSIALAALAFPLAMMFLDVVLRAWRRSRGDR